MEKRREFMYGKEETTFIHSANVVFAISSEHNENNNVMNVVGR